MTIRADIEKLRAVVVECTLSSMPAVWRERGMEILDTFMAHLRASIKEDDERKAFEEWAKKEPWFNDNRSADGYVDTHSNVAWHSWKAANQANVYRAIVCGNGE